MPGNLNHGMIVSVGRLPARGCCTLQLRNSRAVSCTSPSRVKALFMPEPAKRTIKVKPILEDFRAGLGLAALKSKYGLSDRELKAVFNKLASMGVLSPSDLNREQPKGKSSSRQRPELQPKLSTSAAESAAMERRDSPVRPAAPSVLCPRCGTPKESFSDPCSQCDSGQGSSLLRNAPGIPVRPGDRRHVSRRTNSPETRSSNPWVTIGITMVIFAVIGVGLIAISSHRTYVTSSRPPSSSTAGSESIKKFTAENFQTDVVEASKTKPVLVEFYADW